VAGLGLAIPRTHFLAHVAAEHPPAELTGQLVRDVAPMLDRQIRDAAPRVEHVRRDEGPRRTGIEAGRARSTAIGLLLVERKLCGREHDADEEIGAERRGQEVRVLADPAEARAGGQVTLEHRARIDGCSARDRRSGGRADELAELAQARTDHVVVVAPAGVP
jgi:hypothetical protein